MNCSITLLLAGNHLLTAILEVSRQLPGSLPGRCQNEQPALLTRTGVQFFIALEVLTNPIVGSVALPIDSESEGNRNDGKRQCARCDDAEDLPELGHPPLLLFRVDQPVITLLIPPFWVFRILKCKLPPTLSKSSGAFT